MKLSDAIRLGAMLRPQGYGDFFVPDVAEKSVTSCALGAACEAVHGRTSSSLGALKIIYQHWPWLRVQFNDHKCPACGTVGFAENTVDVIMHLNDSHTWTREMIADWVAKHCESVDVPAEGVVREAAAV